MNNNGTGKKDVCKVKETREHTFLFTLDNTDTSRDKERRKIEIGMHWGRGGGEKIKDGRGREKESYS